MANDNVVICEQGNRRGMGKLMGYVESGGSTTVKELP